jgi:hypothetical protein
MHEQYIKTGHNRIPPKLLQFIKHIQPASGRYVKKAIEKTLLNKVDVP